MENPHGGDESSLWEVVGGREFPKFPLYTKW